MTVNCPVGQRQPAALRQSSLRVGHLLLALAGFCYSFHFFAAAQVPGLLNYQGRITVGTTAFEGTGQFKLALVNGDASQTYWRNSADANNDGEPDASVSAPVSRGLYSLMLGDTSLANMAVLPPDVFVHSAVYLRVWFNDGVGGFQRLIPDQRIASAGYSLIAATVSDGAVTAAKLGADLTAQIVALTAQLNALSNRLSTVDSSGLTAVSLDFADTSLTSRNYQTFTTVSAPAWVNGATTDAPTARSGHTAIWTGQELLVWGGDIGQSDPSASGGAYQPLTDQWRVLSPLNAPSARSGHSAVWTGSEMIIWGGAATSGYLNTGGRFDSVSQNWSAMPTSGAPTGRQGHTVAWTGQSMVIWGGLNASGLLADGAIFNSATSQWSALNAANPPSARSAAAVVWTGSRFIVWGGQGASSSLNNGAQLTFNSGVPASGWQTLATTGALSARYGHTAVWTGSKMIVWGGRDGGAYLGDGAWYDPVADSWTALPSAQAPSARANHSAVWTGAEMVVVGGEISSGVLSTGAAYDPVTHKWRSLTNPGLPVARSGATAIWSGTEVLVFGGQANGQPVASLQKLNPQPTWYLYRKP